MLTRSGLLSDRDRDQSKRALGAYYTRANPFVYPAFRDWFSELPSRPMFIEPFAGSGQIPRLLSDAGYDVAWTLYDIDEHLSGVIHRDTLASFPQGFDVTVTNPPYLSLHFATRKGLHADRAYFKGYASLYQTAIAAALASCAHVGMIVPESFLTSERFRRRLRHVVSLPLPMFADTEIPTALALWGPTDTDDDFFVWRKNELIGPFSALAKTIEPTSCAPRIRFNQLDGQIGLKAIDGTGGPSIAFCEPDLIPSAKIKPSARLVSRIKVEDLTIASSVISVANARLRDWRQGTEDVLLTAFKGLRSDDRFRRRLDFANARALLSHALCEVERHDHA